MYIYDYNNGMIEVGSGEVQIGFWTQDYYTVEYECPLCSGSGTVWGTEAQTDEEHEITCPHCNGRGECSDEVYIDVDVYETVEVEGKHVGAYGDNDLYYSYGKVTDAVSEKVHETIQRMIERQKEEREKSLTDEERKAIAKEQEMKQALEKLMAEYQQAKAEAEKIFEF